MGVPRADLVAQSEQNWTRLSRNDTCDILELTLRAIFQWSEYCNGSVAAYCVAHGVMHAREFAIGVAPLGSRSTGLEFRRQR